jgi:hypothetical protein
MPILWIADQVRNDVNVISIGLQMFNVNHEHCVIPAIIANGKARSSR